MTTNKSRSMVILILVAMILAGVGAAWLTNFWLARQPETFRLSATVIVLDEIRTPQESIQYFADLDGALRAFPVRRATSDATGVSMERLNEGLTLTRVGSSSTLRLSYESPSSDPDLAAAVLKQASDQANEYLTEVPHRRVEAESRQAADSLDRAIEESNAALNAYRAFTAEHGDKDFERIALIEERVVIDLRVKVVTAEADANAAARSAVRLRAEADESPWDLDKASAATEAEVEAVNQADLAEVYEDELETAEIANSSLSVLASEKNRLETENERTAEELSSARQADQEARSIAADLEPSFVLEPNAPLVKVRDQTDISRRALIAGASAAGLVLLIGLWWRAAVSTPDDIVAAPAGVLPATTGAVMADQQAVGPVVANGSPAGSVVPDVTVSSGETRIVTGNGSAVPQNPAATPRAQDQPTGR